MKKSYLKDLATGSLVYGVGGMVNRLLNVFLLPVFTAYLGPDDYGVISLVAILTLFLTGLFSLGTGNSMGICFFEMPEENRHEVIWTTFVLVVISAFFFGALSVLFRNEVSFLLFGNTDYSRIITLAILAFFFQSICAPFLSYLRIVRKSKIFVLVNSASVLVGLMLNVVFVVFLGRGVMGMFEASVISSVILFALTLVLVALKLKFSRKLDTLLLSRLIKIGFPSIFGLGAFYVIDWSDRILLEKMMSVEAVGIYFIGYSFGMIVNMIIEAFANAWPPFYISFINRREEATVLFGKIFKYYVVGMGLIVLCFFVFAKPVVHLLTHPKFYDAYSIIGIIACSYMLKGSYLILLPGISFSKRLILQSIIEWSAAGVNIGLNFLLIPLLQIRGAAIATLSAYLILNILCFLIAQRFFSVVFEWRKIAIFTLFCAFVALSSYYQVGSEWVALGLQACLLVGLAVFAFFFTLDEKEREFFRHFNWSPFGR